MLTSEPIRLLTVNVLMLNQLLRFCVYRCWRSILSRMRGAAHLWLIWRARGPSSHIHQGKSLKCQQGRGLNFELHRATLLSQINLISALPVEPVGTRLWAFCWSDVANGNSGRSLTSACLPESVSRREKTSASPVLCSSNEELLSGYDQTNCSIQAGCGSAFISSEDNDWSGHSMGSWKH